MEPSPIIDSFNWVFPQPPRGHITLFFRNNYWHNLRPVRAMRPGERFEARAANLEVVHKSFKITTSEVRTDVGQKARDWLHANGVAFNEWSQSFIILIHLDAATWSLGRSVVQIVKNTTKKPLKTLE
jgi:hypothetical protein